MKAMCGHEAREFRCDRRDGHKGLHAQHDRLRDGYVSVTNWGDDGKAPHATSDAKRLREQSA